MSEAARTLAELAICVLMLGFALAAVVIAAKRAK